MSSTLKTNTGINGLLSTQTEEDNKIFDSIFEGPVKAIDPEELRLKYAYQSQGRRAAPRYGLEFDVIIHSRRGISFRTKSRNISVSGILLKDLLPTEFMVGLIDIVIVWNHGGFKEYMAFRGKAVGEQSRSPRIQFFTATSDSDQTLEAAFIGHDPLSELRAG